MFERFSLRWMLLSAGLLAIYLAFFHVCLDNTQWACRISGVFFWVLWVSVCVAGRTIFANPFEFWVHQLVGMDILLEGFNPLHQGLGFYYCALAFWGVLIAYHCVATLPVGRLMGSQNHEMV